MFGLFDKITEFFQEIFIGIIQANLEAMFLDINENVSLVATEVGKTPSGWNAEVFSFVKNINDTVVIPIAGIIITAIKTFSYTINKFSKVKLLYFTYITKIF